MDPVLQELNDPSLYKAGIVAGCLSKWSDSTFNKPRRRPVPTWAPQIPLEGVQGVNFLHWTKKAGIVAGFLSSGDGRSAALYISLKDPT